jgi:hypothetical protein
MNRHLMRGLLALYPRAFRDRYGTELASVTDELIRGGELTPLLAAVNLLGGAALEWGRVLVYSRHAAQAMTVAAIMAVAGSLYVTSHARPPSTSASVHSSSAPSVIVSVSCGVAANPAGLGTFQVAAGTTAGAKPGQASRVLMPVWVFLPGKLSTETRPLPGSAPEYFNPAAKPAGLCVVWLTPPPAGSNPVMGFMLPRPSS